MDVKTRVIQARMQSKLLQINQKTRDIENVGGLIVEELKRQEQQIDEINDHLDQTSAALDKSKELVRQGYGRRFAIFNTSDQSRNVQYPSKAIRDVASSATVFIEVERRSLIVGRKRWKTKGIYDRSMTNRLTKFTESITNDPSMTIVFSDSNASQRIQDCDGWRYAVKLSSNPGQWGPKRWNTRYRRRAWMEASQAKQTRLKYDYGMDCNDDLDLMQPLGMIADDDDETTTMNCMLNRTSNVTTKAQNYTDETNTQEVDRVLDDITNGLNNIDVIAKEIRSELSVHSKKIHVMDHKMNHVLETEILLVKQMR